MPNFSARIFKLGINPVVDPPDGVLQDIFEQAGRSKGAIAVRGRLNGADFVQTLVKYRGSWRLYVNAPMLKSAEIGVGDIANVEMEFDPEPREVPVPAQFATALDDEPVAKAEFEKLTPSRQKEILLYLSHLKSEESLGRNVEKLIRQFLGKPVDKSHVAVRPGRNRDSA